jgi:5-methylthioadenosine/S-adenosylhomocysteine deaminase
MEIGSIAVGARADLILIDATSPSLTPSPDPFSAIVYSAQPADVRLTMVDGDVVVRDGTPVRMDAEEISREAQGEARALASRAGI